MTSNPELHDLISRFITASHILHYHGVCDAYGHISVRNPHGQSTNTFLMPRSLPPALVSSEEDIVEYKVSDAEPVDPKAPKGYIERNIHAGIYRQYSDVVSVVHAHAAPVVASTVLPEGTFRPVCHNAGFLGPRHPTFDLGSAYAEHEQHDLLIRTLKHGNMLSASLSSPPSSEKKAEPDHAVVLMRGHGFSVTGSSVEIAVYEAYYTMVNADIQSKALAASGGGGGGGGQGLKYLSDREAHDTWFRGNVKTVERPWELWKTEVEERGKEGGLYVNELSRR